jgi:hypothetical protein
MKTTDTPGSKERYRGTQSRERAVMMGLQGQEEEN